MRTVRALEVVRAGALTTVQDLGRPGLAHLGVPRSGAADAPALALANRLVGNAEGAAGLETLLSGCAVRLRHASTVAVTGARAPVTVDDHTAGWGVPLAVPGGAVVELGSPRAGLRSYLAVAGGIAVPPVLGSRSTDTLSGLGPTPLADGDVLPVGPVQGVPGPVDAAPYPAPAADLRLRVRLGPRADWLTQEAIATLLGTAYTISPDCDRVAARLDGPALERADPGRELPSEGLVLGAVQVPGDGQPLIFLADHPTTGGYPVVAVVHPADVPAVAQARPGTPVRFVNQP